MNIELDESHRIYGPAWFRFLRDCRATLGTESGSNVFDFDGDIKRTVTQYCQQHPKASYQDVHKECIGKHEGVIRMNQISPKIFEAIANYTALVLFEGEYSGVVKPHTHFIPLCKDFSNVDTVLDLLHDEAYLTKLTRRAYRDVIESRRYSYRNFVEQFDELLTRRVTRPRNAIPVTTLLGFLNSDQSLGVGHGFPMLSPGSSNGHEPQFLDPWHSRHFQGGVAVLLSFYHRLRFRTSAECLSTIDQRALRKLKGLWRRLVEGCKTVGRIRVGTSSTRPPADTPSPVSSAMPASPRYQNTSTCSAGTTIVEHHEH